jgi:hypothetical protein
MRAYFYCLLSIGLTLIVSCSGKHRTHSSPDSSHNISHISKPGVKNRTDSTQTDTGKIIQLYNQQPTIHLSFLPSGHDLLCKQPLLPYSTDSSDFQIYLERQKILNITDSAFFISKLKAIKPIVVNPDGGTSFGDLDCVMDSAACLHLEDYRHIGIVCALHTDSGFLVHLELTGKAYYVEDMGILMLMSSGGDLKSWIFCNGDLGMNPHGNIIRNLKITSNRRFEITEYSTGDNSDIYDFKSKCKIEGSNVKVLKRKLNMWKRVD